MYQRNTVHVHECTFLLKQIFRTFGFRRNPDQKVSYCVFVPSWLMMYHCKIDTQTEMNWIISIRACQNVKIEQFQELWRIETPCIKIICVGLIFKYGVSCRFHETPTVNVFVRNLIDDVITIKNTALPPHIPRID